MIELQSNLKQWKTLLKTGWYYDIYACFMYLFEEEYSVLITPHISNVLSYFNTTFLIQPSVRSVLQYVFHIFPRVSSCANVPKNRWMEMHFQQVRDCDTVTECAPLLSFEHPGQEVELVLLQYGKEMEFKHLMC